MPFHDIIFPLRRGIYSDGVYNYLKRLNGPCIVDAGARSKYFIEIQHDVHVSDVHFVSNVRTNIARTFISDDINSFYR